MNVTHDLTLGGGLDPERNSNDAKCAVRNTSPEALKVNQLN
jgi:hypothetical protein